MYGVKEAAGQGGAIVELRERLQDSRTRARNQDRERRQPAVNHSARVRPVECGANLDGVTQRLLGRQRTLRKSLGQKLAVHGLIAGKSNFALARFDHD